MENKIELIPGKTIAFRPTPYDVGVLESIRMSHPELADVGDLIRKALREYDISRQGGGIKVKTTQTLEVAGRIEEAVGEIKSGVNFLISCAEKCESVGDAN